MNTPKQQQIIISGVGGQGVLFITRLLAEAAINKGLSVLTSETHGMAQRGGTVVSHFKVGNFSSPLIRPGHADGLIAFKAESIAVHGAYVRDGGWIVANSDAAVAMEAAATVLTLNAEDVAKEINNLRATNLITLGFAIARLPIEGTGPDNLFCALDEIQKVLEARLADKPPLLDAALKALAAGAQVNRRG
jgi:indolepyruvate ferredoxin oxidoreductase beta subunit